MYTNENKQRFPFHADLGPQSPEDWLHWQTGQRDVRESAIAPYVGKFNVNLFRCPSDDISNRPRVLTPIPYIYSYTFNYLFSSNASDTRLGNIVHSSEKFFLVEEDEISIDDGNFHPLLMQSSVENFLATRHTRPRRVNWPNWYFQALAIRPDRDERGNACFADGHVEYVTRGFTWLDTHYDPRK